MVVCRVVCWAASDVAQGFVYFPEPRSSALLATTIQQQFNVYGYSGMYSTQFVVLNIYNNPGLNYS